MPHYKRIRTAEVHDSLLIKKDVFDFSNVGRIKNQEALVSRLPVEIMSMVFRFVQGNNNDSEDDTSIQNEWSWITIIHVCGSWRKIAIGDSTLWAYIETGKHAKFHQTYYFLKWSGTAELVVRHYPGMDQQAMRSLNHILRHEIHRIRELQIWGVESLTNGDFQKPAPALRKFVFQRTSEPEKTLDLGSLFAGEVPKLEEFVFMSGASSWSDAPCLRGLKVLRIGSHLTTKLALGELLHILTANPDLERLDICYLTEGPAVIPHGPYVDLPHLKEFDISETSYDVVRLLLRSIRFPNDVEFEVSCRDFPIANPVSSCIVSNTLNRGMHCKAMHLFVDPFCFRVETDPHRQKMHALIEYNFWETPAFDGPSRVFDAICGVIKNGFWCSVTELCVVINGENFPDLTQVLESFTWIKLLKLLPGLQRLAVQSINIDEDPESILEERHQGLLDALLHVVDDEPDQTKGLLCPRLSELSLDGFSFADGMHVHALLHTLCFRAQNGSRLRWFKVNAPYENTKSTLATLKECDFADQIELNEAEDDGESESDDSYLDEDEDVDELI